MFAGTAGRKPQLLFFGALRPPTTRVPFIYQRKNSVWAHYTMGLRGIRKLRTALFNRLMRKTARPVVGKGCGV